VRPSHLEPRYHFDLTPSQAEILVMIERPHTGEIEQFLVR
jgi:hypothetical protein